MRVLLTGAAGFLGWHTRVRLAAVGMHEVIPVSRDNWDRLPDLVSKIDAVVHIAGVNRGSDAEVREGNVALSHDLVIALQAAQSLPKVIFANSIHAGDDSPYGFGKNRAAELIASAAKQLGFDFVDVRLPNLFGEHGRPRYNSFVQTFASAVIEDYAPQIVDRPIELLHVQGAAQALMDALAPDVAGRRTPAGTLTSVCAVYEKLSAFYALYRMGDVPPLCDALDVDLFNTLRAALFPEHYPVALAPRVDNRGALVEVVRAHGGRGQTFVSTTHPGITRGEHFHLRKIERFVALAGRARISLRRMYDDRVISFDVDGDHPGIVDMPTLWAHNITNIGDTDLTTLFWTNELFDPERPDTYPEPVLATALPARH